MLARTKRGNNLFVKWVLSNLSAIEQNQKAGKALVVSSEELVNEFGYTPARAKVGPVSLTYRNVLVNNNLVFGIGRPEGIADSFAISFRKATSEEVAEAKEKIENWKKMAEARKVK